DVLTYQVENNALKHVATLKVKSGSGPRHITFHPDGTHAFLISELSSEVAVLKYDDHNGTFTVKQYIKTIPESFTETNDASAIHITKDGDFIYVGNRGHNSIAVFQVNQDTMELTLVEIVSSGGEWPRDFTLDPSESFLVASNQHSGNVVLFKRDTVSGKLTQTTSEIKVPEDVCFTFLILITCNERNENMKSQIGVIGLDVMSKNLAFNIESRGYYVAVYNRTASKTEVFMANEAKGKNFQDTY